MDGVTEEANHQPDTKSLSDEENDVFEDLPKKPALRRLKDGQKGKQRHKPDRIKSWYIRGPTDFGVTNVAEPSAIAVSRICDVAELASEADVALSDPDAETPEFSFFRSVCASRDGLRIYFLLNESSLLYRLADGRLTARALRLSDQTGKRLRPRHVCVNEEDRLVFIAADLDIDDSSFNLLARFRLPEDEQWTSDDKDAELKYLGRTKMFENMDKFGSLHQHEVPPPRTSSESGTEHKENENGAESSGDLNESGVWIVSPQTSQSDIEKTQIFKLTNDFKHKRCTVSLGRHGVCYLPYHVSVDDGGWVYVSSEKIESGPHGSTKLHSGRLLTFPSRPPADCESSQQTKSWMRVNSWHFEGIRPSHAVGLTPGERALVLDRERGSLHKVSWECCAIEGHGEAGCFPVLMKPDADTFTLPLSFDGIGRLDEASVFLYKNLAIYRLSKKDLD